MGTSLANDVLGRLGTHADVAHLSATATLTADQRVVYVDTTSAVTLTLADAGICGFGAVVVIKIETYSNSCTVQSAETTPLINSAIAVDEGYMILMSDGNRWYSIAEDLT